MCWSCFGLAHSMFNDGYSPHKDVEKNPLDTERMTPPVCSVSWCHFLWTWSGSRFVVVIGLFKKKTQKNQKKNFWSLLVGRGWAKAIGRKMWCMCPVCTILFLFCKKSWTIFDNKSKWWKMLLSCLVFICLPSFGILFKSFKW